MMNLLMYLSLTCIKIILLSSDTMTDNYIELLQVKKPRNTRDAAKERTSRDMLPKTRRLLKAFFMPFNYGLQKLTNDTKWTWNW